MKSDNPLSQEYLRLYPLEAARVLEELASDDVAGLFNELSTGLSAPVLSAMLPDRAALCLVSMAPAVAAKVLSDMSPGQAARLYRLLAPEAQETIVGSMSADTLRRMHHFIHYAAVSAGDLMEPNVPMLPADITIGEAIRRVEHLHQPVPCEIYIVDDGHRLLGHLELGQLLTANHHLRVREVINRHAQPLAAHASAESLFSHPGWLRRRRLPVVERDNTLVGVLDFARLHELSVEAIQGARDTQGGLMSLFGLYWLTVIQLLDSLFGMVGARKGAQR